MSLTIAICDDNDDQIAELRRLLGEWSMDKPFALDIDEYVSGESFLFSYPDKPCSLLLLDIEMLRVSGLELAKRLRSQGDMLPIIFITGYSEYMSEGYDVEALHYLLKPVSREKLFCVLDRYVKKHTFENEIMLECGKRTMHISPDQIIYCEALGKKTQVCLSNGQLLECHMGIGGLKNKFGGEFSYCHRSYIVNLRYVRSIGKAEVYLDGGKAVPLSRRLYREMNERFIAFYTK